MRYFKYKILFLLLIASILNITTHANPNNILIVINTSKGKVFAELYPDKAPKTVNKFLNYVDSSFYDNTIFHRVYKGFMIQGGGYTTDLKEKENQNTPIENEATNGLSNVRGSLAMARLNDPHSATNQFFINTVDNSRGLDFKEKNKFKYGYAVFGKIFHGMKIVDLIENQPIHTVGPFQHVPKEPIIIHSIKRLNPKKPKTKLTKI